MTAFEIPEDFETLKAWIKAEEEKQKQQTEEIGQLSKILEGERDLQQLLRRQLDEVNARIKKIEENKNSIRKRLRESKSVISQAQRRLEVLASEKEIEERLKREAEKFDRITAHYKWREFAFSHQLDGAKRLASAKRGILGDKRGLGKTLTSLIWADMLDAKRVIAFAPKDVLKNFEREVKYWTPHRNAVVIQGMNKTQRDLFLSLMAAQDQFFILINYEAWRKDKELIQRLIDLKADSIIVDEAHNIKEFSTSAFQGIRKIVYADNKCPQCGGSPERFKDAFTGRYNLRCSSCLRVSTGTGEFCSVKNVLLMTGTAILNKPQDLAAPLNLVDRVLFPSKQAFLRDYCVVNVNTGRWTFRSGGEEALISKLGSRYVRRDKNSIGVKTPPQVREEHRIEFDKELYPDQWKVMQQIIKYGAIKMSEEVRLDINGILPYILRRRQAITWPAGIKIWGTDEEGNKISLYEAPATESIKMDKAMEIAGQVIYEDEDRLVIFSQFKEALKELERRFNEQGVSVIRYDGDLSDDMAQQAQFDFDAKYAPNHPKGSTCNPLCVNWEKKDCSGYKWQVIVAHYKKGGVGLNLNAARQMILLDREWNPGKEDQALGRIDRIDNTHGTVVHTIHVEGTIDAFMDKLIEEKAKMITGFEEQQNIFEEILQALKDGNLL